jgi:hypothetical protein
MTRLQLKRTRRNALSKHKRYLSRRGIENQKIALRNTRQRNAAWSRASLAAHMKDPISFRRAEPLVEKKKPGFFSRLFRRGNA